MIFSSITFLFYFLPVFCLLYYGVRGVTAKNIVLLYASLLFYLWGEPWFVTMLVLIILFNYAIALAISTSDEWPKNAWTAAGIAGNLLILGIFKYYDFVVDNLAPFFGKDISTVGHLGFLPLGISFISFHAISYLVDVKRHTVAANKSWLQVAVYLSMFPQLVAGPIVRYNTIFRRLAKRRVTVARSSAGVRIFIIGLAQKVLIADETARIAEVVFDRLPAPSLIESWLGVGAYTLQIYFDFMGYSNMAVGLAFMLGLRFPRNFRLPYISRSVTEFWRRWHMSLSAWFRDYVYIPLGGNRRSKSRTFVNLGTVFLLCGFWHGANWTFLVWGAHHGFFLIIERAGLAARLRAAPSVVAWFYALLAVMLGWVWFRFRAKDISRATEMFAAMAGFNGFASIDFLTRIVLYPTTVGALLIGGVLAVVWVPYQKLAPRPAWLSDSMATALLFILSVISVAAGSYSPFLYFRF